MRGRTIKLSAARRLVGDLMRFSIGVPRVTVQRQMNRGARQKARMSQSSSPYWTVIFLKGNALVSQG
ncbi:hypothetical protein C9413_31665, partial [Rhizobium sp. SEMIA 4085]|nr:hypothetical protein [Rhizobium sp. SEMIA 4085]